MTKRDKEKFIKEMIENDCPEFIENTYSDKDNKKYVKFSIERFLIWLREKHCE